MKSLIKKGFIMAQRFYRNICANYFTSFELSYKLSNIFIAIDRYEKGMEKALLTCLKELYDVVESFCALNPEFYYSLVPVRFKSRSKIINDMIYSSKMADVGPMAAVAGAIADSMASFLESKFKTSEYIIENGGDIALKTLKKATVGIYAGDSFFSGKIAIELSKGYHGVCTSSGKVGHSLSFGNADAVAIVSRNAAIADAFATSYANRVRTSTDCLKIVNGNIHHAIKTILIIIDDTFGYQGKNKVIQTNNIFNYL